MCPPAQLQILQQEFHTQKQVRTIQHAQVLLLYWCQCVMSSAAVCYFRLCVSAGRNSWYFSGFELAGLNRGCEFREGQGQDHMVIQDSPGVVPELCPSGQRCQ